VLQKDLPTFTIIVKAVRPRYLRLLFVELRNLPMAVAAVSIREAFG